MIPKDIEDEAVRLCEAHIGWPTCEIVMMAILAERQRCADVASRYLEDIAGCDMNDDEPDKIAAAVLDPDWQPPPL